MRVLVTGGAGFIGSNFIRHLLAPHADIQVLNFDNLSYAGNPENLAGIQNDARYTFVKGDITSSEAVNQLLAHPFDVLVHFAAETHVDRSIEDAAPFLETNVLGTHCLLEAARRVPNLRFIHISTDEVYGSALSGACFTEQSLLDPRSPYAASKASAEHLVQAYANTYRLSTVILRCTNNFGPFQFPEKLIPLCIANALEDKPLPVYGDGLQERDWLFVDDFCRAIERSIERAKPGSLYNVSSGVSQPNLNIVRLILQTLGKPESLIQYVRDRPGHDRRYALDSSIIRKELEWKPMVPFEEGIRRTIDWYKHNPQWLDHARSGQYRDYYQRHYDLRSRTLQT
ncbi:MAG TPA: dTDP-glucose 4,6-dehydratase [Candidatus Eisenbacteria bacterium]|nr:dTDP-glucose 4,6-dehydratase [Candidatus Eisenbacteria bacterium]